MCCILETRNRVGLPLVISTTGQQAGRKTDAGSILPRIVVEAKALTMGKAAGEQVPVPWIASTRWDSQPAYSPDGQRIAFASTRSGHYEIWMCDHDGSNPVRLTRFEGPLVSTPRWSPDGEQIVFEVHRAGWADLYVESARASSFLRIEEDLTNSGGFHTRAARRWG